MGTGIYGRGRRIGGIEDHRSGGIGAGIVDPFTRARAIAFHIIDKDVLRVAAAPCNDAQEQYEEIFHMQAGFGLKIFRKILVVAEA
jgi:hypothetical protein